MGGSGVKEGNKFFEQSRPGAGIAAYTAILPQEGKNMRMMMKVSIPVETGNDVVRRGSLGSTIQKILAEMKPEAAYFAEDGGQRTGYIFFDMKDSSQLPAVAEPWFLALNASLTVRPAMTPEDLGNATPAIQRAVENFG